jgi:DNA-binding transcriptional LysR family regulator
VAAGVGSALLPLMAVDLRDERTVAIDLAGKLPPRVIGVAWHRDRHWSPAAESFVNLAASVTDCLELPAARATA